MILIETGADGKKIGILLAGMCIVQIKCTQVVFRVYRPRVLNLNLNNIKFITINMNLVTVRIRLCLRLTRS